jgi:hypothetical protein
VKEALLAQIGDEGKLVMLNVRLILRTGVNLQNISVLQAEDHRLVLKVIDALGEMGFNLGEPGKAKGG